MAYNEEELRAIPPKGWQPIAVDLPPRELRERRAETIVWCIPDWRHR